MKNITTPYSTMRTVVLPLLSAALMVGVAEAASSGVRVHRIGDPPLLPRGYVQPQAAPVHKAHVEKPQEVRHAGQAVPLAPVGQEVSSAPVSVVQAPPAVPHRRVDSVPLAPLSQSAAAPAQVKTKPLATPPAPQPAAVPVRSSNLPLAPTYVATTAPAPAAAPAAVKKPQAAPAPQPQLPRRRLPIAPVGY